MPLDEWLVLAFFLKENEKQYANVLLSSNVNTQAALSAAANMLNKHYMPWIKVEDELKKLSEEAKLDESTHYTLYRGNSTDPFPTLEMREKKVNETTPRHEQDSDGFTAFDKRQ